MKRNEGFELFKLIDTFDLTEDDKTELMDKFREVTQR